MSTNGDTLAICYTTVNSFPRIPVNSDQLCNDGMENKEIRRANMLLLSKRAGTMKALADATDSDPAHLSQIKSGFRDMGDDVARRFEARLEKPRGWMDVLQLDGASEPDAPDYVNEGPSVPVIGTAQLGDDGFWYELQYPVGQGEGFVRYPARDPNTYALRVKGDSMWPRIRPGEFVVIEPNHELVFGEEVMVQTTNGRSMIKILVSRRNGLVELHSINGAHKPITLEESEIAKIHYVGGIIKASLYYEKSY